MHFATLLSSWQPLRSATQQQSSNVHQDGVSKPVLAFPASLNDHKSNPPQKKIPRRENRQKGQKNSCPIDLGEPRPEDLRLLWIEQKKCVLIEVNPNS